MALHQFKKSTKCFHNFEGICLLKMMLECVKETLKMIQLVDTFVGKCLNLSTKLIITKATMNCFSDHIIKLTIKVSFLYMDIHL